MDYLKERLQQLGYTVLRIDNTKLITENHKADIYFTKDGKTSSIMIYDDDTSDTVIERIAKGS